MSESVFENFGSFWTHVEVVILTQTTGKEGYSLFVGVPCW